MVGCLWYVVVVDIQEVLLNNVFQGWIDHPVWFVVKRLVVVCLLMDLRWVWILWWLI